MINTAKVLGRRDVCYADLSEFINDVEQLAATEHRTLGNWTLAQIIQHLADTMKFSLDGFPTKAPWFARTFIAPLIKNSYLTRPLKPGLKLPKDAEVLLPPSDTNLQTALHNLRRVVSRMEHETPSAPHPFFGPLASQEWEAMHLRHAALHLSFVVPTAEGT